MLGPIEMAFRALVSQRDTANNCEACSVYELSSVQVLQRLQEVVSRLIGTVVDGWQDVSVACRRRVPRPDMQAQRRSQAPFSTGYDRFRIAARALAR
jgi:hypothetical protein